MSTYGWAGTVADFLRADIGTVGRRLSEHHAAAYISAAGMQQVHAWDRELQWLSAALHTVPTSLGWGLVLEYELPFEGGRRPDAVLLAGDRILVLEFKESATATQAQIDQVQAYARDLEDYQSECRNRIVLPILALLNNPDLDERFEGMPIVGPTYLPQALDVMQGRGDQINLEGWLGGVYAPLPTLVEAARTVFRDEPLPAIKSVQNAGIPRLLTWLHAVVRKASEAGTRHLILITGVPGSGKTLVGLQFVHESGQLDEPDAYFLSGNGPLVEVLQDALRSKVFVRSMHNFILEYGVHGTTLPAVHAFVFDEAQRAWDVNYMATKKHHARSEPEILMDLAGRLPAWGVVIGLVGQGQEIYLGEEAGLGQWRQAVETAAGHFQIHVPPELTPIFAGLDVAENDELDLGVTLRAHRAEQAHAWVSALMDGDLKSASAAGEQIARAGYDVYVTRDRMPARRYLDDRYADAGEKKYGLLASAKAKNLKPLGIDNEYRWLKSLAPKWFNSPRSDPKSCCQLAMPMTEFQVQGLELDMPVVCWGDDLGWESGWAAYRRMLNAKDSRQLRLNAYRVLLSRGRDGAIVYVPDNLRPGQQDVIVDVLRSVGARDLTLG